MRSIKAFPFGRLAGALLGSTALLCGSGLTAQSFTPARRIVDRIDESRLATLKGNTHPYANAKNDRGRVSPDLPMTDLILVLSRDPAQQAAFEQFVASQYDENSPNFHQWLTPQQVGENFGPSEADLATVSNWLTGHGFSVDEIPSDHMSIRFSGNASQVESAFHSEMHNLEVKGVAHIGNMSDPRIPASLAPAVTGVKALHNFFPRPLHHTGSAVSRDAATGKWKRNASTSGASPLFGINVPASGQNGAYLVEDLAPYDFATIYNVLPLWSAGIDGTGQTIAIAGTSSINPADVSNFRTTFGLPTSNPANTPVLRSGNGQPLTMCTSTSSTASCGLGDLIENSLDVEWSGAVAKNAQIILVSSYPASLSDDNLYDSESYIVHNLTSHIMNVSYGECELFNGTAGNVEYYNLWQSAYTEGIAVFVASGDSGAASCDQGYDSQFGVPWTAEYGLSVSGLASTPYNVAVGGTDFNWCSLLTIWNNGVCTPAPYWNSTNSSVSAGQSSAKGYIPELPWNDTCTSPLALGFLGAFASSPPYSVTGINNAEEACNFIVDYDYQGYSNGVEGLYSYDPNLLSIVDTVGGSGGASGCVANDGTNVSSCVSTITSTGATTNPDTNAAQGSIPLVNDGWPKPIWQTGVIGIPQDGVRDIPDVSFFASDGWLSSSAYLICVSEGGYTCTYSTNKEPIAQEVGGTSVATPAMAGVMALINQKAGAIQGNPNAELYKLAARQTYSNCSAETATTSNGCLFNDIDQGTIAMACDYGAYGHLSPNCPAPVDSVSGVHGGPDKVGILSGYSAGTGYDLATGLGSLNVANVVNNFLAIGNHPATVTVTPQNLSINVNQALTVSVTVASGFSGGPTPTGTVMLASGSSNSGLQTLSTSGSCTAASCAIIIPVNSLNAGVGIVLTATYSGDSTYASESNTAAVTVIQEPTFTLAATAVTIASPGATSANTSTVTTTAIAGYAGTVTSFTCTESASNPYNQTGDTPVCTPPTGPLAMGETATLTIQTFAPSSAALAYPRLPGKGRGWEGAGGGAVLAFLLFLGIPSRRHGWRSMLGILVVMAALGGLSACGGGGGGGSTTTVTNPGTTIGTYYFTVTGTGSPAITPAPFITFSVTVN